MDPVVRRKIPACVRLLLTDSAAKEEEHLSDWPEIDSESITTKDGIALPQRGTNETLLTPANGTEGGTTASSIKPCGLCLSNPSCYTCPRCNIPYCGLACYKSQNHSSCSEEFYKESVLQELKSQGVTDEEGKSKMQEILLRLRQSAESEGGMENLLRNLGDDETSVTEKDAHALELLSQLAEIQSSGDEKSHEVQELLAKLRDIEDGSDEEEADLAEKLAGLDIDSISEEELWSLLSAQEKEKFERLVKEGSIGGLVVLWSPWWERHEKDTKALIEELQSENDEKMHNVNVKKDRKIKKVSSNKVKSDQSQRSPIPPISAKIAPLHTLSSNPSPLVRYNLINALYGYTFSLCLYNGDISEMLLEFCQVVLAISDGLGARRVFNSVSEALDAGIRAVSAGGYFDREDPLAPLRAVEAVAHILTGESREGAVGYSLSALSQLRTALSKAKASVPKEEEQMRRMYFQAGKKCEFFQSWVKENPKVLRSLAGCVWTDYERREMERMTLEGEKKCLEKGRENSRGKGGLIEEIE
ncbi:zinc finger HIT domain-containing protein 2-like [Sinocyclocheilus rhinocerous]|uniref:Zinc finger HIT domain-containing protein 2-like n=1 Tax=Sinocyclocheilus rhinocerous TaxID=307959 RepID=A0A673I1G1_9TELE|nr:PREDICTED: zinc finger HIT domain-containing protein 2-like [Sinocyclocheilus rhinocerous]XP_016381467.1 PREDICTED: zinc finger HIT domain-containing protein 2-like [Sinocyclocheilus rhinocerous]